MVFRPQPLNIICHQKKPELLKKKKVDARSRVKNIQDEHGIPRCAKQQEKYKATEIMLKGYKCQSEGAPIGQF